MSIYVTATVWTMDPQAPILIFHRFVPPRKSPSDPTRVLLEDFHNELQGLYDAGYSLVSLQDWIEGDLSLPAGRKPLAITIDDAFFGDQISLDSNGIPLGNTGLGILWQFAQLHPDFGFKASLFANLGDKFYGNIPYRDWFIFDDRWKQVLGDVIAWCLDHDVGVYNHLYKSSPIGPYQAGRCSFRGGKKRFGDAVFPDQFRTRQLDFAASQYHSSSLWIVATKQSRSAKHPELPGSGRKTRASHF